MYDLRYWGQRRILFLNVKLNIPLITRNLSEAYFNELYPLHQASMKRLEERKQ